MDLVARDAQSCGQRNVLHSNPRHEGIKNVRNYSRASREKINSDIMLIVFDTSGLLRDVTLLPLCIKRLCHVLIPYTVVRELEGLKKAELTKLKRKVAETNGFLNKYKENGCRYFHVENMREACFGVKEFGCENNDDVILKCAFTAAKKYKDERVFVVLVTNDKNLALKSIAHGVFTVDKRELLNVLMIRTVGSRKKLPLAAEPTIWQLLQYKLATKAAKTTRRNSPQHKFAKIPTPRNVRDHAHSRNRNSKAKYLAENDRTD
ncbi:unnamed protein product [Litomosoides sigmodontis]|uniref:PIN domain-containing protein n=1 Tax=Litomosoides sigmodontis TaxID=42156 RepID=A0A3P6T2A1_LITSI|nr:unnamed protein product [Litomosoides sigmodontis]